jgi:hypothetical protein
VNIEIIAKEARRLLATNLQPPIEAGAQGIAAAVQNVLAPYPAAPPRIAGRGYYIRGKGQFTAGGRLVKASETLNRKWSIRKVPWGSRLRNTASYAVWVHGKTKQNRYHGKRGWVREDQAAEQVTASGEAKQIMAAAIAAAFKESSR